jgi:hypothetical protein
MAHSRAFAIATLAASLGAVGTANADSTARAMPISVQVVRSCKVQTNGVDASVDCGSRQSSPQVAADAAHPVQTFGARATDGAKVVTINF